MTSTAIAPDTIVGTARLGRWTHPGAWWLWSLLLAVTASRTTNPLFLILLICVLALVVHRRERPGGRTFTFFLRIAAVIVVIRVLAQMLLGGAWGDTVIATLPSGGWSGLEYFLKQWCPLSRWCAGGCQTPNEVTR